MRFSHKDKKDKRIVKHSTYPLDFPAKLDEAPEGHGVFVFLNTESDVMYVGHDHDANLRNDIETKKDSAAAHGISAYRWFRTENIEAANSLASSWIEKYSPFNQHAM